MTDVLDVASEVGTTVPSPRAHPVTIPVYRYTSPEFFAREAEELWPRVWQFACTIDHVANPGEYYEYKIGRISVLIVRGDDGELRAFQNACRHRGSELCAGAGEGLTEIRCPFHRWSWDLAGRLREVPSRRVFGVLNDDLPLLPVQVGVWGPMVYVNPDPDAEPLEEFLGEVLDDTAWARLDEFRCYAAVTVHAPCNWKTLIDGFSETYHVQGIHREMLGMCDDVNGQQRIWKRHGKLVQPYGLSSPRIRNKPDDQAIWESFVEVMGTRVGRPVHEDPGPKPEPQDGESLRDSIARIIRQRSLDNGADISDFGLEQVVDMHQYNLFPNITVLVFGDMLTVVRSRPGDTPDRAYMDAFTFDRRPTGDTSPRSRPFDMEVPEGGEIPLGLILGQDHDNFARSQKGLYAPGLTHLSVSPTEECRIINLHRNLEEYLDISPSELGGMDGWPGPLGVDPATA
jgi:nitrite reductase/ring-hydroxylating ferredoxin subunit